MPSSFCILTMYGDLLDDGELHFVEEVQTPEIARQRVEAPAESKPGRYVIYSDENGERVFVSAGMDMIHRRP